MIHAVLVDDERPALRELEFLLKKHPEIWVTGIFDNPLQALESIRQLKPQVVFLDIFMPQLRGIDAASRILEDSPDTDIVFVTAFDNYAIEAFELNALDYVLKPINEARFNKTIERLLERKTAVRQGSAKKLLINSFGRFRVGMAGKDPIRWRSEKTKELFAFLLQYQGQYVSKEEILNKLWTYEDPDKAIKLLYNGVYYIRKALKDGGSDSIVTGSGENYCLKLGAAEWDAADFYRLAEDDMIESLEKMEGLYEGDYLQGEDYLWADIERERLVNIYIKCLVGISKWHTSRKRPDKAEDYLMKAYDKNPYNEDITELLMRLYMETGNKSKAVKHFTAYSKLMRAELGIRPNKKLQELYRLI